jgi:hypothetical protein
MGGLSSRQNLVFLAAPLQWGNLIAIQEALFVQLADPVRHLCKPFHTLLKNPTTETLSHEPFSITFLL